MRFAPPTPHAPAAGHDREMLCIPTKYLRGKSGLSRVEIALLAFVYEHPNSPASRHEIAQDCGCADNSIPRAAKKLEAMGLIERVMVPGLATTYRPKERNTEVTRNTQVTVEASVVGETCNSNVTTLPIVCVEPKQTTTDGVVTALRGVVTSPPRPPYKIITPTPLTESNLQTPEGGGDRGLGKEPFALDGEEPKSRQRRKPRREATDDTMPAEMTARMVSDAAAAGYLNGSGEALFRQWRDNHIAKATMIANHEASFRTWIGNAPKFGTPPPRKTQAGYSRGIRRNPYIQPAKHT